MLDKVPHQPVSCSLCSHKTHLVGTLNIHNPNLFTGVLMPKSLCVFVSFLANTLAWHLWSPTGWSLFLQLITHSTPIWQSSHTSTLPVIGTQHIPYSLRYCREFPLTRTLPLPLKSCYFSFRGQVSFCQRNDQKKNLSNIN